MRRLSLIFALATALVGLGGTVAPEAFASTPSACYVPENNVRLTVDPVNLSGLTAYNTVTGETSALTFNGQEWTWKTSSSDANTCLSHDYIILNLFGEDVGYIDPPCCATIYSD